MPYRGLALLATLVAIDLVALAPRAQTPPPTKAPTQAVPAARTNEVEMVEHLLAVRKDYQKTLEDLRLHYIRAGDLERVRWVEEELVNYHRVPKHALILDLDVPPPNLSGHTNVPEANKWLLKAREYKDKGWGSDYIDNQRRAELLLQELLNKYPQSDKISDAAFLLGDIYESKAYKQYRRAARYYERCYQWNPKTQYDARLRAARLYDATIKDRGKAIEVYREITTHDADPARVRESEKRLKELMSPTSR